MCVLIINYYASTRRGTKMVGVSIFTFFHVRVFNNKDTRNNRIHEIHILLLNIDYMYNEIKPLSSVQHTKKTHNTQTTLTLTHMSQLAPVY